MWLVTLSLYLASTAFTARPVASDISTARYGWAKHYSPGLMRSVLHVRQRQGLIPYGVSGYDGLASTTECANIGRYVRTSLQNPRTGEWSSPRTLLVVDCSRPGADRARHIRTGLVVEVDWYTARATGWGWDGRSGEGKARARVWGVK